MVAVTIWRIMMAVMLGLVALAAGGLPAPIAMGAAQSCTNTAKFVSDVTVPDNTIVRPGKAFTKTWRLENTGNCTWTTSYKLVRDSGNLAGGPTSVRLARAVPGGGTVDLSVRLIAPSAPGAYTGVWQMADGSTSSRRFGPKIRVVIVVPDPRRGESLPETVTFMGGAGGQTIEESCVQGASSAEGQQVRITPTSLRDPGTHLCIYGLPAYSTARVTLINPTGARSTAEFSVGGTLPGFTWPGGHATIVGIALTWPATVAGGDWRLSVQGEGLSSDIGLHVSAAERESELSVSPLDSFNPFDTVYDETGMVGNTLSYAIGERVQINGGGYPPNRRLLLGIYQQENAEKYTLVHSEANATDRAGRFKTVFHIPDTYTVGRYWAVARLPEIEESAQARGLILGSPGTRPFFVRGGIDDPLPYFEASVREPAGESVQIDLSGSNLGRSATRGASLTVSSPDAERLEIVQADVPVRPSSGSDCNVGMPYARVLTPETPCHKALQHNTACKKTIDLTNPIAEAVYKPWATGEWHGLSVQVWPRPGLREVRLYARMSLLAGSSGCRIVTAPEAANADGTDQQGFPVQVISVAVKIPATEAPAVESSPEATSGCEGTAIDATEPPLWFREADKLNGEAVRRLQTRLLELGYRLPAYGADGWFGSETEAAVKEFQRRNGLEVDGYVGPITWACLKNAYAARGD